MTPNETVRAIRMERGETLRQFGVVVGLDHTVLSRIENGLRISADMAIKLARATGHPLVEFYPEAAGLVVEAGRARTLRDAG